MPRLGELADLESLVLEVTPACNNACVHCYNYWRGTGYRQTTGPGLSRGEIRAFIGRLSRESPLAQVAISGGEPLLRRDLPEILADLTDLGVRPVIITNGSLLSAQLLQRLPAGSIFEITLFSADRGTHDAMAGRRRFDRVVHNLVLLERLKHRFVLACVVTKRNADQLKQTIKLGVALGAEGVCLNRINLSRRTVALGDQLVPSAAMLQRCLGTVDRMAASFGIQVAVAVPIPPCVADPGDYPHIRFGWCPRGGRGSYYTVGWDGNVRPCNHSSVILGDVRESSLPDIVACEKARSFWAGEPSECRSCTHRLREECRGGCPAAASECYGTTSRVDPFVKFAMGVPNLLPLDSGAA